MRGNGLYYFETISLVFSYFGILRFREKPIPILSLELEIACSGGFWENV